MTTQGDDETKEMGVDSSIALEEQPTRSIYIGPLAPKGQLHALIYDHSISNRLSAKQRRFARMRLLPGGRIQRPNACILVRVVDIELTSVSDDGRVVPNRG